MDIWKTPSSADWTFTDGLVAGHGGGSGPYRASYAVKADAGAILNGHITADLRPLDRHATGLGLVCRADDFRTFIAFYVAPEVPEGESFARIGVFREGVLTQVSTSAVPVDLPRGDSRFALEFYSAHIRGEIRARDETYEVTARCAHVPLPGYAGLLRLYGSNILARNVAVHGTNMPSLPPVERSDPETGFDVFLCHSSADTEKVLEVAKALADAGVTYWLDAEQIKFGDPVTQKIEDGLHRSRYVVPCLSANLTATGNWTRAEYGAVLNAELSGDSTRIVVPLALDDQQDGYIPLLLRDKKRVSFTNKTEFEQFLLFLRSRLR